MSITTYSNDGVVGGQLLNTCVCHFGSSISECSKLPVFQFLWRLAFAMFVGILLVLNLVIFSGIKTWVLIMPLQI